MLKSDDTSIWDSFLSGDDQAYECIYKQHIQKLFLYGTTLTKDEDLIKDCIQDVFIYMFKNRQHLGKVSNIRSYLVMALRNTMMNSYRKQNSYNKFKNSLEKEYVDDDTAIEKMIEQENELKSTEQINNLWLVMTDRQKEIIYYKFFEELSLEEISQRLGIEYHSVANVIQRALKKMRNFLSQK